MKINPITLASVAYGLATKGKQTQVVEQESAELIAQRNAIVAKEKYYRSLEEKHENYLPTEDKDSNYLDKLFDLSWNWRLEQYLNGWYSMVDITLNPKMKGDYLYKIDSSIFFPIVGETMEVFTHDYTLVKYSTIEQMFLGDSVTRTVERKEAISMPLNAIYPGSQALIFRDGVAAHLRIYERLISLSDECNRSLEQLATKAGTTGYRIPAMIGVYLQGAYSSVGAPVFKRGVFGTVTCQKYAHLMMHFQRPDGSYVTQVLGKALPQETQSMMYSHEVENKFIKDAIK